MDILRHLVLLKKQIQ